MQRCFGTILTMAMILSSGIIACGELDKKDKNGKPADKLQPISDDKTTKGGTVEGPNPAFLGRVGLDADNYHILGWPGSRVVIAFTGDKIEVPLSFITTGLGFGVFANAQIDEQQIPLEKVTNKEFQTYTFEVPTEQINNPVHTLTIIKSSSPAYGNLRVGEIKLNEQDQQLKTTLPATKLLFIGDSISVGYGVTAQSANECSTTAESENVSQLEVIDKLSDVNKAFPWLVGQKLNADVQIIAISGRGLAQNRPSSGDVPTMPQLWKNFNPSSDTVLLTADETWVPDAIVINLGTNDFANPDMTADTFAQAGKNLVQDIRTIYPTSKIVFVTGPMAFGTDVPELAEGTKQIITDNSLEFIAEVGVQDPEAFPTGCDTHPSEKVQSLIADHLVGGQQETSPYIIGTKRWKGLKTILGN